jgi:phage terminase small subunit
MEVELNQKQELFCKHYVSREFFGSGVEAYAEAYGLELSNPKEYNNAKVCASKLLTNANILIRINELLDDAGLNDSFVDKQLLIAITQNADLNSKVKAISEYNKLKQRITIKTDNKHTGTINANFGSTIIQPPPESKTNT